ncbi:helix-turn-helix domain-containing protein [Streptomyces composti]|uniref:helix-turn-helix domain-containing protein n=1 Tax=Streptomyces composti TaxID=2720025 RepID=UPI002810A416|nr:helix-turn-helix domain-containing protein [Streptomyces composti]
MTVSAQGGGQDEVTGFAALLRELKERTDRSYGSLARRLGMNTSTLHRYCAGEAVPVDFAPIERFAALCGASPEERLELHRRWLSATAARRRPRGNGGSATAAAQGSGGTGTAGTGDRQQRTTTEPGPAGEPPRSAPEADAPATERPEAATDRPEPAPDVPSAPEDPEPKRSGQEGSEQTGAGPTSPRPPADTDTPPPAPADAPAPEPAQGTGHVLDGVVQGPLTPTASTTRRPSSDRAEAPHGAAPGRRRWYRRKRVLVAAVCAVLAVVGSLSALPDAGKRPASQGVRATDGPTAGSTATGPRHGRSASPSTADSGSPAENSASGRGTEDGGLRPGTKPSSPASEDGGTARNAPGGGSAGSPLVWTLDSHVWEGGCGHDYVIGKPPAKVPPPPAAQDAPAWAAAQGAVHGGKTQVEVSVQGKSEAAVVLTALRVRVAGRAEPVAGNAYAMDQGCGGALTPRSFDVDLDKDRPVARAVPGNDAGTPIPAVRLPYRVSSKEPEVLLVTARTGTCDCRWYLELDWSSQGRTGTVRIDDHGRPFRTSAVDGLPHYEYDTLNRRWRPRST